MLTMTSVRVGSLNHCGFEAPTSPTTSPSRPTTGSKKNGQTRPTPTPESTNGENAAARAKPTPLTRLVSARATISPSTIEPPTVATVKIAVVTRTLLVSGEVKNSL